MELTPALTHYLDQLREQHHLTYVWSKPDTASLEQHLYLEIPSTQFITLTTYLENPKHDLDATVDDDTCWIDLSELITNPVDKEKLPDLYPQDSHHRLLKLQKH